MYTYLTIPAGQGLAILLHVRRRVDFVPPPPPLPAVWAAPLQLLLQRQAQDSGLLSPGTILQYHKQHNWLLVYFCLRLCVCLRVTFTKLGFHSPVLVLFVLSLDFRVCFVLFRSPNEISRVSCPFVPAIHAFSYSRAPKSGFTFTFTSFACCLLSFFLSSSVLNFYSTLLYHGYYRTRVQSLCVYAPFADAFSWLKGLDVATSPMLVSFSRPSFTRQSQISPPWIEQRRHGWRGQ